MIKKKFIKNIILISAVVLIGIFTGGKTVANENLSLKEQNIVMISSYTAYGDTNKLESALNKGLDEGLTINEIKEILVQLYAYCGFPRSLNGISAFIKVTDERNILGKKDKTGKAGNQLSANTDKKEYGTKVQTELIGSPAQGRYIEFTPAIDEFLKSHLFADIFGRGVLTGKEREIATISALSSMEGVNPQLNAHIQIGKNTGLKDSEIDEILSLTKYSRSGVFPLGVENTAYAQYFIGQSYLQPLTTDGVSSSNVTFEPKCRNNWHIHHKGGQILLVTYGRGYYQEWGKAAQELKKGDVVNIPAGVKHWHGAAKDSWFSHVAIAIPADDASTEWLEPVGDEEYNLLK